MKLDDLTFRSNLERRVRNLALGHRTPSNALVPLFEAIYNAIHALQDRFDSTWQEQGKINVELLGLADRSIDFVVSDNGVGLDSNNFKSFLTYDSDMKAKRGGKGVGRLSWLKVFNHAEIVSVFNEDSRLWRRSFHLVLNSDTPITNYKLEEISGETVGTHVRMRGMRSDYAAHVPNQFETVTRKLVAHFLPYLVSKKRPTIIVSTESDETDLGAYLESKEVHLSIEQVQVGVSDSLTLEHNLLEKGVTESDTAHTLYFSAHGRVVQSFDIGLALGIKTLIERDGRRYLYAGVVSGDLLNENVNSERTSFDIDESLINQIKLAAIKTVEIVLAPQVERVVTQQTDITKSVVKKYPRFAYLVGDPREFVERRVPKSVRTAEQIYQQLSIYDFRANREIERNVERISHEESEEAIRTGVDEILAKVTEREYSILADYTVRRKVILDLLERRMGYKPDGSMKHFSEQALHEFVLPMRATAHDVHVDHHNLWIVDDKLTYYEHWASDKQLRKFVASSASEERPDVVLFSGRTAFHRPGTDQPIVIIEFKKPARAGYPEDDNPFSQIAGYVEELRSGRAIDGNGAIIQEVGENTPFFCYLIADLTPSLRRWLDIAQINVPLPGGGGFYGYNPTYKCFFQVLSYKYVLKDARLRNEAFFKQLGI